jgi:hypothetical protein
MPLVADHFIRGPAIETGKELPDYDGLQFMGTLQMVAVDRVFHVFELVPRPS